VLAFTVVHEERIWPETVVKEFKLIAQVFDNAWNSGQTERGCPSNLCWIWRIPEAMAWF